MKLKDVLNVLCADEIEVAYYDKRDRAIMRGDMLHISATASSMGFLSCDVLAVEPIGPRAVQLRIDYR